MNKKYVKKEIEFAGKKLILETGELAERADMAVKASYGDTVLLITVVHADATVDQDFLGLRVEYEERLYASGSIKGSRFIKRDGKATDDAIISKRIIDHAVRPLFPKDYVDEIQLVVTVLSLDDGDPEFLSMIGSAACLQASEIPFYGPMSSIRLGMVDGKFVPCPTREVLHEKSDLEMMVSFVGEEKKFLALEAGANVLPEDKLIESINFARTSVDPLIALINDFAKEVNPENKKHSYATKAVDEAMVKAVEDLAKAKIEKIVEMGLEKLEKDAKLKEVAVEVLASLEATYAKPAIRAILADIEKHSIKSLMLEKGKRVDGRGVKEVRAISTKIGVLPRVHGSGIFTRGNTQALTIATLGSPSDELLIQDMFGERTKRFIHYYNFPPYSTGEVGRFGAPKGREIGHGMIAEKGLKPVIPSQEEFPYTILLTSEILSSNGSSSMAATCGSTLALMDAGVPIKAMVAGVAMGLIVADETFSKYVVLTDLNGEEDGGGYLDFKMTGTREGVTAIQCDMKVKGLPMHVLEEVILQSKEGRLFILNEMEKTISKPKESLSQYAPRMVTIKIDPEKIGTVIGTGGKTIREIQETTNTEVHIDDDGTVVISSYSQEDADKALSIIDGLTREVKPGEIYEGTVVGLLDFGALVEILPGKTGLLHVSELADTYVKNVTDYVKEGDIVKVKVLRVERDGKMSLSKRAVDARE